MPPGKRLILYIQTKLKGSSNTVQSEDGDTSAPGAPQDAKPIKTHPHDMGSLDGASVPRLNKHALKATMVGLAFLVGGGLALGFDIIQLPERSRSGDADVEERSVFSGGRGTIPGWLRLNESHYYDRPDTEEEDDAPDSPTAPSNLYDDLYAPREPRVSQEPQYTSFVQDPPPVLTERDSLVTQPDSSQVPQTDEASRPPQLVPRSTMPPPEPSSDPTVPAQAAPFPMPNRSRATQQPPPAPVSPDQQARESGLFFTNFGQSSSQPARAGGEDRESRTQEQLASLQREQAAQQRMTDYDRQNQQDYKRAFLADAQQSGGVYLDADWIDPFDPTVELKAGTVIPITMVTGINSDLPGEIIAQVIEDVYDTVTGSNLLIPRGSRVLGSYDSAIAFGQGRILIIFERLLWPDGTSISLRGMQGVDAQGLAGIDGEVDMHVSSIAKGLALASGFQITEAGVIAALSSNAFLRTIGDLMRTEEQVSAASAIAEEYARRWIDRQPTITVEAGTRGSIMVNKDIILPPYTVTYW